MSSSLAQLALKKARARMAGQAVWIKPDPMKPTSIHVRKKEQADDSATLRSLGVIVDGPINHFMFLEGRRLALDLAKSLSALGAHEVIISLQRSAVGRPGSYAQGIVSVIDLIREASHANEA
ncbi:hypothetical protein [Pseudomonas fluorescens]|uniref:Uncharacterized protein n=1 Tax=Pseudomonas fluorescens TaxID=294 RepID=A0A5E7EV76_PSEFL|nr:hypothetical protein [Pseudomonas fluorescens]VVO30845.1 hypothetical protein PS723_04978 [Pseudomonas fluorescens]